MWLQLGLTLVVAGYGLCSSPRADDCITTGYRCSLDCSAVIQCPAVGGSAIPIQPCTGTGLLCGYDATSPYFHSCLASSCPAGYPFTCNDDNGERFPDPYNPSMSYLCVTVGEPPVQQCECPEGQCYSTIDGEECRLNGNDTCGRPIPNCAEVGQSDAYSDDRYFYTCNANGVAQVGKCPDGMIFEPQPAPGTCVIAPPPPPFQNTPTTTKVLGTCGPYIPPGDGGITDTPTPTPTTTSAPFKCKYAGEQFPGPNCTSYYKCNSALKPILINCVYENTHYEPPPIGGCVPGPCTRQDFEFYQYIQEPTFEDEDYESQPLAGKSRVYP